MRLYKKITLALLFCVGFFLLYVALAFTVSYQEGSIPKSTEIIPFLTQKTKTQIGLPVRLSIPKLSIDAVIEHVGVTPEETMDVPKIPANTAWFKLGPRPGESGSAVISGHYGWKNNVSAVFDNLHTLESGDKLYVEDERGSVITFVVRESRLYDPEADASDVFTSNDEEVHLNLITCEGVWDDVSKSYSKRLVVFTDMEI